MKFYSTLEVGTNKTLLGLEDKDYYLTYINPNRIMAENPLNNSMANYI